MREDASSDGDVRGEERRDRSAEAEPRRICVLVRPSELPGVAAYFAGAFTARSAAEAARATLPLVDRARAEIHEVSIDDLRPRHP